VAVFAPQAVGVILVSAMLITPAATAYLLTDRMQKMLFFSVVLGVVSSIGGWWITTLDVRFQTGPMITLLSSSLFVMGYFFAPQHGVMAKFLRRTRQQSRVHRENTLKAIYRIIERKNIKAGGVSVELLARARKITIDQVEQDGTSLVRAGEATWEEGKTAIYLTASGWRRAVEIVRNHRLWELYLTDQADYSADHVHDDAEKIEHILGVEASMQLESVSGKQEETGY